ncbi:MAG TPA: dTDP-glucose 4,6-dehydratase [Oligoflexia bacterium]|nr:dTDP-glucose 4,6-dehydratase [Oligoflexia bacterium]HMP26404.1 dTDP-glucose 4,6-dehydratase [Oligoflexia bacterium]
MKVLVTGAAGFIGSNLIHLLSKERSNWRLFALDLLTYAGNLENLEPLISQDKISFIRGDVCDRDLMNALFGEHRFDLIFHLAAESHVDRSILNSEAFVKTNVLGTQVLLDALRGFSKNARFIHVSTDEVYGSLGATGRFLETTPLDPSSPYSASKAASDLLVLAAHKTYKLNVIVTRCTNNYGPYQFPEKIIPLFVTNAMGDQSLPVYGDGLQVRSWLWVEDHCLALLKIAENGLAGEIYNIGCESEGELPNLELTKMILKLLGKPESLIQHVADRPAHDRRYAVDTSKIREQLGWRPKISIHEGLIKTVDWYRANVAWWQRIKSGAYLEYYKKNYADRDSLGEQIIN